MSLLAVGNITMQTFVAEVCMERLDSQLEGLWVIINKNINNSYQNPIMVAIEKPHVFKDE